MIDTKERAKQILEEYANCYSQVDLEELAKYLAEIKVEAYKEFADKLCEGRVSNDNTVILAKCLLKELVGE